MNSRSLSSSLQLILLALYLSLVGCRAPAELSDESADVVSPTSPTAPVERISYAHPSGISLQYPAGWEFTSTEIPDGYPVVVFVDPRDPDASSPRISLEVYDRLPEDRDVTDPYTWQPNEGGYEVQWSQPITMAEAEGVELIWARQIGSALEDGTLMAVAYSELHQLDMRLSMTLPDTTLQEGETEGWESVISDFGAFQEMLTTIVIEP